MAESWDAALRRVFAANELRGEGPTSFRSLAIAMGDETMRRTVNRVKQKNRASEKTAQRLSRALQVPREELPAAKRATIGDLEDRLDDLDDHLGELSALAARGFVALGATPGQLRPPVEDQDPEEEAR